MGIVSEVSIMSRTCRIKKTPDSRVERLTNARTYRMHRDGTVTFDWDDERTRTKRAVSKARRRGDRMVVVRELACG